MTDIQFKQSNTANYTAGRTGAIQYIVIHYTANNGDTAKNNADYFARTKASASAHYFVDESETVWQSVKDTDTAWHCGATGSLTYKHRQCRNSNSLGIELCSRKTGNGIYYFKEETIANAAALTAQLASKYGIPTGNILRHYDVTGKICPAPMVNDNAQWSRFKEMVEHILNSPEPDQDEDPFSGADPEAMPAFWSEEAVTWAIEEGILFGNEKGQLLLHHGATREAFIVFLYRLHKLFRAAEKGPFPGVADYSSISLWAAGAMTWAVTNGILFGNGKDLLASDYVTREQAVTFLYRYHSMICCDIPDERISFSDYNLTDVSSYALPAVCWAIARGILAGDGKGNVTPQQLLTREQAVCFLFRYRDYLM